MNINENIKELRSKKGLTLEQLGASVGVSKQTIQRYETGQIATIPYDKIVLLARALSVTPQYLMGWEASVQPALPPYDSISPITKQVLPLLGNVACGEPIFADQQVECYVQADHPIQADYVLHAKGDSMTGARIYDGDLVFVRQQSSVENGEIAVVLIGDDVTLKRVYFYPEQQLLLLQPENPAYKTIQIMGEDLERVKIIGKAVLAQISLK